MIGEATRVGLAISLVIGAGLVVACSGADSGATEVQGFSDFALEVDSPTGTLDATTVRPVLEAFEKASSVGREGGLSHLVPMADTSDAVCPSGGSASSTGSGDESSGELRVRFAGCCVEGGCCLNGIWHTAHEAGGPTASTYSVCTHYDVSALCDGESQVVDYVSCTDESDKTVYSVQIDGKRFSVSGSEGHGGGVSTIVDVQGIWVCAVDEGAGTCTGPTGTIAF